MFLFCVLSASSLLLASGEERSFLTWMRTHNYIFTGNEYFLRLGIFLTNARRVSEFNRKRTTFTVSLNQFAHFTPAEFAELFPPIHAQIPSPTNKPAPRGEVPDSFDWRDKNVVTVIKDQGNCGSCWAFSTTAVTESLYAMSTSNLLLLSEQSLVDCCTACRGCGGGDPLFAFEFISDKWNRGLPRSSDYGYVGYQKTCQDIYQKYGNVGALSVVTAFDEEEMKEACATIGPLSALQKSNLWSYVFYSQGIYREEGCSQLDFDHAVCVVGYGSENGDDYWIVKNSMGNTWGEDGYMRLARNAGNMCGIASRTIAVRPAP